MTTAILVPARLASTRFPRKLLHPIRGKPLVAWVAERIAAQVPHLPLFFAVDHADIAAELHARGFKTVMTGVHHASGTDRLAEANAQLGADFVINVQADEPLVTAQQIEALQKLITTGRCPMATLGVRFSRPEDFRNPNQVKVVVSREGEALYFSRAPLPFDRDAGGEVTAAWLANAPVYRHLGLYAYSGAFLRAFSSLPPGRLEQIEKLEQLRVLENGHRIGVGVTDQATIGIDTPEDVAAFERLLDQQERAGPAAT